MGKIEKKVIKKYFQAILEGKKNFEIRLADFHCSEGDILVLKEWDEEKSKYTGRVIEKLITYILRTKDLNFWTKEEVEKNGYQIISFK